MNLKLHKIMALVLMLCIVSSHANTTTQKQTKKQKWELVETAVLSIAIGAIIGTVLFNRFFKTSYRVSHYHRDNDNSNNANFLKDNADFAIKELQKDAKNGWAIQEYKLVIRSQPKNIPGATSSLEEVTE